MGRVTVSFDISMYTIEVATNPSHRPGPGGYGMNIAQGVPIGNISVVVTEQWYNGEIGYYPGYGIDDLDTSESSNFAKWGHFSQLVWKASQSVGCYTQSACGANNGAPPGDYTVCMYYPPGKQAFHVCLLAELLLTLTLQETSSAISLRLAHL